MNERVFQQGLSHELSEFCLAQAQKTRILSHLRGMPVRRKLRLSAAAAVAMIAALTVIGTLAWILTPTIADWLERRDRPDVSSAFLQNAPIASPLAQQRIGDVTVTVWEAIADEKTFMTNTQFQYEGEDDTTLAAFGGLTYEITPEKGVLYVSAVSCFGDASNEIYSVVQADEHTLSILTEGWQNNNLNDTLSIEITLLSAAEPEPEKAIVEVPVASLATLESCSLPEPFAFGETGFVIKSVNVVRTELRVYFSCEISGAQRPLASAVRNLEVWIFDQDGTRLYSTLSYEKPIPQMLVAQVVDTGSREIVEQVLLQLEEDQYIPLQTTGEGTL